jgi:ubiquinone/menaquinone biosynthesis C-methylase UbiE
MVNNRKVHNLLRVSYYFYQIKLFFTHLLKGIHDFVYYFGVDIRLCRKEPSFTAIEHNSHEEVNNYYSSPDKQYELSSKAHQRFFIEIINRLKSENIDLNNKKIADFGCGIGNLIFHINNSYSPAENFGFDFSETILKLALERFPNAVFKQHDLYNELNQTFDFVFCTEVIEHLLYPEKALKNILNTIKNSGGGAFITVPDGRKDTFAGHINFWSPESWDVFIKNQAIKADKIQTGYITPECLFALIKY